MSSMLVGLDLGQMSDYTAIAILEQTMPEGAEQYHYAVRHLERPRLGTYYPQIVERVGALLATPALAGAHLIVDATGVGIGVVDLFRQAGIYLTAITITGGDLVYHEGSSTRVPKRDLVAAIAVLLQTDRLQVAKELGLASTLVTELLNFKMKIDPITAHDSYGCWRDGTHDDLVLAVALACWYGENGGPRYLPFAETGDARPAWGGGGDDFFGSSSWGSSWGFGR